MARGDVHWFNRALFDLGTKKHDLSADSFKLGIVTSTLAPTINTADPRWGSGGTSDFSANQVPTGTGYTGPIALASVTWSQVSSVPTFRANIVTVPQDASGFSTAAYGIIYNDTDAGKRALGFIDLGGPVGNVAGPLDIDWNGATNDVFTNPAA